MGELPGGGNRKPRTATPLAWRLLYLTCLGFIAWCFHSTKSATSQIAADVQFEITTLMETTAAFKETTTRSSGARDETKAAVTEAVEKSIAKVHSHLEGLPEHLAQAVASDVRGAVHKELAEMRAALAPTIEAAVQKELAAMRAALVPSVEASVQKELKALQKELKEREATTVKLLEDLAAKAAQPAAVAAGKPAAAAAVPAKAEAAAPVEAAPVEAAPVESTTHAALPLKEDAAPAAVAHAAATAATTATASTPDSADIAPASVATDSADVAPAASIADSADVAPAASVADSADVAPATETSLAVGATGDATQDSAAGAAGGAAGVVAAVGTHAEVDAAEEEASPPKAVEHEEP